MGMPCPKTRRVRRILMSHQYAIRLAGRMPPARRKGRRNEKKESGRRKRKQEPMWVPPSRIRRPRVD
jgi:hypothetical protein